MKKHFIIFLFSVLNPLYSFGDAYTVEYKGLKYEIDTQTMSATLVKGDCEYSGKISIPNEIVYNGRTLPVSFIARSAFENCKITCLTIPESVKKIAHQGDVTLDELIIQDGESAITIENSIINYKKPINHVYLGRDIYYARKVETYSGNGNVLFNPGYYSSNDLEINNVVFGNKVRKINVELFVSCIIHNIEFGNNMEFASNIGNNIHFKCPIKLPESVKKLPKYGLGVYIEMPSLILPNSLEIIPDDAFGSCHANEIIMGNNTKEIGNYAFYGNNITYIEIPSTIEKIGRNAFADCQKLMAVYIKSIAPLNISVLDVQIFDDKTYIDGTLYVPKGTVNLYKEHKTFSKFFNVKEYDGSSVIGDQKESDETIASPYLTIVIQGKPVSFTLSDKPVISYLNNQLVVATSKETVEIPVGDISSIVFSGTSTAIHNLMSEGKPQVKGGLAYFSDLKPGTLVYVFTSDGKNIAKVKADYNGTAQVSLSDFPKGVYLLKAGKQTIKIINK